MVVAHIRANAWLRRGRKKEILRDKTLAHTPKRAKKKFRKKQIFITNLKKRIRAH